MATQNTGFAAYDYVTAREAAEQQAVLQEVDPEPQGNEVTDPRPDFLKKKEAAQDQQKQQAKPSNKKNKKKAKAQPSQEPTRENKPSDDSQQAQEQAQDSQSESKAGTSKAEKLAAKAKGESTASKKQSGTGSGRKKKFSDSAVIRVKPEYKNPDAAKKPKTKAHKMYEILVQCDGMTVADYEKALDNQWPDRPASYSASHELDWCANKKGFITVEDPEAETQAA